MKLKKTQQNISKEGKQGDRIKRNKSKRKQWRRWIFCENVNEIGKFAERLLMKNRTWVIILGKK